MSRALNVRDRVWALVAAAAVVGWGVTPVAAADLGGDCCADLEERIAELEATTARKGNRKVSLEVSGHVNQTVLYWDDGFEDNVGVYTNDNSRTRFRFKGKAKINADWEAGYIIEIGVRSANSKRFTQDNDLGDATATDVGLDIRDSNWYIKNKSLGTLAIGLQSTATDGVTEINQTQTADFSKFSDVEDSGLGLNLRNSASGLSSRYQYRRLIGVNGDQAGEGEKRFNGVRYTTPEFSGFSASAFWGEDDFWDVSLRYKGEFAGLKVAGGIGYGEVTDGLQTQTGCSASQANLGTTFTLNTASDADCKQFGGSVSVVHAESGLFVNFAAGIKQDDLIADITLFANPAVDADDEDTFWAVQAGIEQKWNAFGKTTIYGEYFDHNGGSNNRTIEGSFAGVGGGRAAVLSTGLESYGFGVAQGFDAAALTLYISYRHVKGDLTASSIDNGADNGTADGVSINAVDLEDLDIVLAGGIIKF